MKKGAQPVAAPVQEAAPVAHVEEPVKEVPQSGFGRFEYSNGTLYVGNWKLSHGHKVKHGHGKITFPAVGGGNPATADLGAEEYEGDWEEDVMQGYGKYRYTSGASYNGQWLKGKH
jgi:hypothetical protein